MDTIRMTLYPVIQNGWTFSKYPTNRHGFFHRNRIVTNRSPPLVQLYKSTLPVFRSNKLGYDWNLVEPSTLEVFQWKARRYDWNLVDSIGQPSERTGYVTFDISVNRTHGRPNTFSCSTWFVKFETYSKCVRSRCQPDSKWWYPSYYPFYRVVRVCCCEVCVLLWSVFECVVRRHFSLQRARAAIIFAPVFGFRGETNMLT